MTYSGRAFLQRRTTRLAAVARRFIRRDGDAEDPPALLPGDIPEEHLPTLIHGWQRLLESEFESAVVAGWMTSALARLHLPVDVLAAFAHMTMDEVRHVDVCADVLEALGAEPTLPPAPVPPPPAADDPAAREELCASLLNFFVVGELVSAAEFKQTLKMARLPLAVWAVTEIIRDEALHGPFGFEAARLLVPALPADVRARLSRRVEEDLLALERRMGGPLEGVPADLTARDVELITLGMPPPVVMLGVFYETVGAQVVPRIAELGLQVGVSPARR